LRADKGILSVAKDLGVGTGIVQRIKREMAGRPLDGVNAADGASNGISNERTLCGRRAFSFGTLTALPPSAKSPRLTSAGRIIGAPGANCRASPRSRQNLTNKRHTVITSSVGSIGEHVVIVC